MIGFDLQEVAKVKNPEKLLEKIALPREIEYIKKFKRDFKQKTASLWAVKEATFKALNIKSGDVSFKEIELDHLPSGRPKIVLSGKAKKSFEKIGTNIDVSISHQKSIVGAVVVIT